MNIIKVNSTNLLFITYTTSHRIRIVHHETHRPSNAHTYIGACPQWLTYNILSDGKVWWIVSLIVRDQSLVTTIHHSDTCLAYSTLTKNWDTETRNNLSLYTSCLLIVCGLRSSTIMSVWLIETEPLKFFNLKKFC